MVTGGGGGGGHGGGGARLGAHCAHRAHPALTACVPAQFVRKFLPPPAVPSPPQKCLNCNFAAWAGVDSMCMYEWCSTSCEDAGKSDKPFHVADDGPKSALSGRKPVISEFAHCIAVYPTPKPKEERPGYAQLLEKFKQAAPDGALTRNAVPP